MVDGFRVNNRKDRIITGVRRNAHRLVSRKTFGERLTRTEETRGQNHAGEGVLEYVLINSGSLTEQVFMENVLGLVP